MAYHIYHTEALLLAGAPVGEGDKLYHCYTRELGLVHARARSVRESRSKLRYTLQTFAHVDADLIEGKSGWRLISARPISSFHSLWGDENKRRIIANYGALIRRLIQGEERHATLFDDVLLSLRFLEEIENNDELRDAELLLVVRLVSQLGYWGNDEKFSAFLDSSALRKESLARVSPLRKELLEGVNQALTLSHL